MNLSTIFTIVAGALLGLVLASAAGFAVWILWEDVVPVIFTKLVSEGYLPSDIGLWNAILLSWFFRILLGTSSSNTNNSK